MTTVIENTSVDTELNIAELTEASLTGKGVFDVLLQTLRLHLDREFRDGRITGTAYATVYSQALTVFLQQSMQFCLSKAKLALELKQMQEGIELTQLQQTKLIADTRQTDYITDYQLAAEITLKTKQVELLQYDLTNIKPTELSIAQQEIELKTKQVGLIEYDLTVIKPQELALLAQQIANLESQQSQIEAETDKVLYQVAYMLPEEVTVIKRNQDQLLAQTNKITTDTVVTIKQGHLTDAQTCQVKAQTNQVNAEVSLKLPEDVELVKRNQASVTAQIAQATSQTNLLVYDLTTTKPVETANLTLTGVNLTKQGDLLESQKTVSDKQALSIEAETAKVSYQTTVMLPEEVKVTQFNQDQLVAQTTKVAVDTIVASKQGNLVDAQVCEVKARTNEVNATVGLKLPEEVELIKRNQLSTAAQTALLTYDLNSTKPTELLLVSAKVDAETYITANKLPAEVDSITAQTANTTAQTLNVVKQGNLLDSQKEVADKQALNTEAETAKINYQTTYMLPEEVELVKRNQLNVTAQIGEVNYRVSSLMPSQVASTNAQTGEITYRTSNLLPAQLANTVAQTGQVTAQTAQVTYTTANLLPAQVTSTDAQTASTSAQAALYTQKKVTELAQTTTIPAAGSVLNMQNELMFRQAQNYLRDAEQKAAKIMTETWSVRFNQDDTIPYAPAGLSDTNIASAVTKLLNGIT